MSLSQRLWRISIALIVLGAACVLLANFLVIRGSAGRSYQSVEAIPHRQVGLLLGCVRVVPGGGENPFFSARIEAAAKLYSAGKIDYVLVSGDNNNNSYNEPLDMRDALIEAKVPRDLIYMDYAGFRTLDSVVRAREVFGLEQVTIISQEFHNARAIYIAEHEGMDAIGFNARPVALQFSFGTLVRERFARAKAVLDVALGKHPRFLGPAVHIGIDAPVEPTSGSRH